MLGKSLAHPFLHDLSTTGFLSSHIPLEQDYSGKAVQERTPKRILLPDGGASGRLWEMISFSRTLTFSLSYFENEDLAPATREKLLTI